MIIYIISIICDDDYGLLSTLIISLLGKFSLIKTFTNENLLKEIYILCDMIILGDVYTSPSLFYHQDDRRWFFTNSDLLTKKSNNCFMQQKQHQLNPLTATVQTFFIKREIPAQVFYYFQNAYGGCFYLL